MSTFETIVEFILRIEGEYAEDIFDRGGETKWGISKRAFPDLDVRHLTREQAKEIYRVEYWGRCQCEKLPAPLAMVLMDGAVNQGPERAIRMLQQALAVRADGIIGPETVEAAGRADLRAAVLELIARRAYRYALHPEVTRFGLGWYRRLAACHQLANQPL